MNQPAPALSHLNFIKGEPVSLSPFQKGKVYVLEFWATWCPPCRTTIPHLSQLQQQYGDDVIFIGIRDFDHCSYLGITDEAPSTVQPFVDSMGSQMDYRVAIDEQREGIDVELGHV